MASLLPDVHAGTRYLANVRVTCGTGFYVGLTTALFCGLLLIWLWQPQRQVRRDTQKIFRQVEAKNWSAVSDLIGSDYRDPWNHDRTNVIERMREVMRYLRGMRIVTEEPVIKIDNRNAVWMGKITIEGETKFPGHAVRASMASHFRQAVGLETGSRQQSGAATAIRIRIEGLCCL